MQCIPQFLQNHLMFFFMKLFANVLGITLMFNTPWHLFPPCWGAGAFWGIFWSILVFVPLFLENCWVSYHEILYKRPSYHFDTHYTKKYVHIISPSAGGHFGVHYWHMFLYFLTLINIFSWNFVKMFLLLLWWLLY